MKPRATRRASSSPVIRSLSVFSYKKKNKKKHKIPAARSCSVYNVRTYLYNNNGISVTGPLGTLRHSKQHLPAASGSGGKKKKKKKSTLSRM